jgi:hypothetical protein
MARSTEPDRPSTAPPTLPAAVQVILDANRELAHADRRLLFQNFYCLWLDEPELLSGYAVLEDRYVKLLGGWRPGNDIDNNRWLIAQVAQAEEKAEQDRKQIEDQQTKLGGWGKKTDPSIAERDDEVVRLRNENLPGGGHRTFGQILTIIERRWPKNERGGPITAKALQAAYNRRKGEN